MKYWVYVHTCPNGKKYVGCTTQENPEYRWNRGAGYKDQLFGRAIQKYGWDNITHEIIEIESEEEMYRKEIELISFFHSNDPKFGYNCSSGGEGSTGPHLKARGKSFSEEHRKKIGEANRRRAQDPEFRAKISKSLKGNTCMVHPKLKWLFPDGTVREMSIQNASKLYLNRGINIIKLN